MRAILVNEVVEIDEEVSEVRDLVFGLFNVREREQGTDKKPNKLDTFHP